MCVCVCVLCLSASLLVGNEESHSFNTEALLIREMLSLGRKHPLPGHPWYDPDKPALKNLRICPSIASPTNPGHTQCFHREKAPESGTQSGTQVPFGKEHRHKWTSEN